MSYNSEDKVFVNLADFYASTVKANEASPARIVHCVNPFPAKPGTEHDRAQRVTLASMERARKIAGLLSPQLEIVLVQVKLAQDEPVNLIDFDMSRDLTRTVLDLKSFQRSRPLPLVMDVLTAVPVEPDDIFIFTNVDIALAPDFYAFIASIFERGADCAIVNRRTISGVYRGEADIPLMESESGAPHPGFDCFALRGSLRNRLFRYDSCVGIGGVMLPLVHQLLAIAEQPVVLLDAHATYHLGNDRQWSSDDYADYSEHNRHEIDNLFRSLLQDDALKMRLLRRLRGVHKGWVYPERLRGIGGDDPRNWPERKNRGVVGHVLSKLGSKFRR